MTDRIDLLPAVIGTQYPHLLQADVGMGVPTPRVINEMVAELLSGTHQELLERQTLGLSAFSIATVPTTELPPQVGGDLGEEVAMFWASRPDLRVRIAVASSVVAVLAVVDRLKPLLNLRPGLRRGAGLSAASATGTALPLRMLCWALQEGAVLSTDDFNLRARVHVRDFTVVVAVAMDSAEPL